MNGIKGAEEKSDFQIVWFNLDCLLSFTLITFSGKGNLIGELLPLTLNQEPLVLYNSSHFEACL